MDIMKRNRILPFAAALVAAAIGFGAGWWHGNGSGADTMATLAGQAAAGHAFAQAELALAGWEDADAASARKRDTAQLHMALDVLGGIVLSGRWHPPCNAREAGTQAAIARHFEAHPIAADDPAKPILQAGQRYCGSVASR